MSNKFLLKDDELKDVVGGVNPSIFIYEGELNTANIPLRKEPDVNAEVIEVLALYSGIGVVELNCGGGFVGCYAKGKKHVLQGYIQEQYITKTK